MTIKSLVHGFLKTNGSTETLPRPTSEKRDLCESPPAARYAQLSGPGLNTDHDGLWHESDLCGHLPVHQRRDDLSGIGHSRTDQHALDPNALLLTGSTIDASRCESAQADPCSGQSAIVRWVSMG